MNFGLLFSLLSIFVFINKIENVLGGGYRSRRKIDTPSMQPTEEAYDDGMWNCLSFCFCVSTLLQLSD